MLHWENSSENKGENFLLLCQIHCICSGIIVNVFFPICFFFFICYVLVFFVFDIRFKKAYLVLASFLQREEVAGVKRKFVLEGPVAQDVTTPPLVNERDRSTGPGQNTLTHTFTHCDAAGMQQLSPRSRQLWKGWSIIVSCVCDSVCVCATGPGVMGLLRAGRGSCLLWRPRDCQRRRGSSHIIDQSEKRESEQTLMLCSVLSYFKTYPDGRHIVVWGHSFPSCKQRKVTLGVTCAKWQELGAYFHHGFSLFLLFLSSCDFVVFGATPEQRANRQPTIFTSVLRTPVCSLWLPICPISSGKRSWRRRALKALSLSFFCWQCG